jgi:hypothetical protein
LFPLLLYYKDKKYSVTLQAFKGLLLNNFQGIASLPKV